MEMPGHSDVTLEYELSLSSAELVIGYKVTNGTSASIWLTTPLGRVSDEGTVDPDPQRVYAYLDPEGVLHVTKRVWPIPEDVDVYRPEPVFSTEVSPGTTFAESLRLSVPVRRRVGYAWLDVGSNKGPKGPGHAESTKFSFSIDYMRAPLGKSGERAPARLRGEPVEVAVAVINES